MIETRTSFIPFKMRIGRKEPVCLLLELLNSGSEPEIVSLELNLGKQFSLEKTGFRNYATEKIPEFKPGETKKFYYDLWPKQMARPGEQEIKLAVTEHYKGFNYVKKTHNRVLKLAVEE